MQDIILYILIFYIFLEKILKPPIKYMTFDIRINILLIRGLIFPPKFNYSIKSQSIFTNILTFQIESFTHLIISMIFSSEESIYPRTGQIFNKILEVSLKRHGKSHEYFNTYN